MPAALCIGGLSGLAGTRGGTAAAADSYTVTDLNALLGSNSTPIAINDHGHIAGDLSTSPRSSHPFLYDGSVHDLGTLGGGTGGATGINNADQVVGSAATASGLMHAFVYDGSMHDLGTLETDGYSAGLAINASGHVVGNASINSTAHAMFYDGTLHDVGVLAGDGYSDATGINNADHGTGYVAVSTGIYHAFLYDGAMHDLGTLQTGGYSQATGINAHDHVVGYAGPAGFNGPYHAFLYDGTMSDLGTLGGDYSYAFGINNADQIVGYASTGTQDSHAFLYDGAMHDLNSLIPADSGWVLTQATAINNVGQIIGSGVHNGVGANFLLTPASQGGTGPTVSCATPDSLWHGSDVSIPCSASAGGSPLANPADASFTLSTSVPAGTETDNASTNSYTVCDVAENCATAGPIAGIKVDKKPPAITITTPTNTVYTLNQSVTADYVCTDGGSGVATCTGPVGDGAPVDTTSVGVTPFTVNAADNVGNTASQSVSYTVTYNICLLFDPNQPRRGTIIQIPLQLCDVTGGNVSSPGIAVKAVSLDISPIQAPGNGFRYNPRLGGTGGYQYSIWAKSLRRGTHTLSFTAGSDPTLHTVQFQLA